MTPTDPLDSEIRRLVVSVADRAPSPPVASELTGHVHQRRRGSTVGAALVAAAAVVTVGALALRHDNGSRISVIAPPETDDASGTVGASAATTVATLAVPSADRGTGSVAPEVGEPLPSPPPETTSPTPVAAVSNVEPAQMADDRLAQAARDGQLVLVEGLPAGSSVRGWSTFPLDESFVPRRIFVKDGDHDALVEALAVRSAECGNDAVELEPIAGLRARRCPTVFGESAIAVGDVSDRQVQLYSGRRITIDELRAVIGADLAGSIADGWRQVEALNGAGSRANQHSTSVNILRAGGDVIKELDGGETWIGLYVTVRTGVPNEAAWIDQTGPTRSVEIRGKAGRIVEDEGGLAAVRWIEMEGMVVEVSGYTTGEVVAVAEGLRFVTPIELPRWAEEPRLLVDPTAIEPALALAGLSTYGGDGSQLQAIYEGGEPGAALRVILAAEAGELSTKSEAVVQSHRDVGCADVMVDGHPARLLVDQWGSPALAWQYAPGLVVGLSTGTRTIRPTVIPTPDQLVALAETVHIPAVDEWVAAISDLGPGVPLGEPKDVELRDIEDGPTICPWP